MKKLTVKVIAAGVAVTGLSAIIAVTSVPVAIAACFIGWLVVWDCHRDRCRYCGSWRVKIWQERYPDELTPDWTAVTDFRACKNKNCRVQEIDHRLLREPNPFHL